VGECVFSKDGFLKGTGGNLQLGDKYPIHIIPSAYILTSAASQSMRK
jgi:hypothetical protein